MNKLTSFCILTTACLGGVSFLTFNNGFLLAFLSRLEMSGSDILTLLAFVKGHEEDKAGAVALVGTAGAGPLVATARVLVQDLVDKAVVGTGGFRFVNVKHYRDPEFLPGAVKYGDLPGLLSLAAPLPLWLAGEKGRVPQRVQAVYKAMKRPKYVVSQKGDESDAVMAAVPWLLGQ